MVGEYKVEIQEGKYYLVNDDRVLKLNYKKRANLKASNLFITSSRNTYISSLYVTDDIIQSTKLNCLEGSYTADFNKVNYVFNFKENYCFVSQKKGSK